MTSQNNDISIDVPVNVPVNLTERELKIITKIQEHSTITVKSLSEQLNVNDKTIKRDIVSLKERGIIERQGSDKNGRWVVK